jgi:hypothetical protein
MPGLDSDLPNSTANCGEPWLPVKIATAIGHLGALKFWQPKIETTQNINIKNKS